MFNSENAIVVQIYKGLCNIRYNLYSKQKEHGIHFRSTWTTIDERIFTHSHTHTKYAMQTITFPIIQSIFQYYTNEFTKSSTQQIHNHPTKTQQTNIQIDFNETKTTTKNA